MIKLITLLFMLIPFSTFAEDDFLSNYVAGNYSLIGQGIDSKSTYSGKVSIYLENERLVVKRTINGNVILGVARFKPVLNGDANVLRIQFSEGGINYEETCLFRSDLDNYARITCHLYIPGADITKPGIEALFIEQALN